MARNKEDNYYDENPVSRELTRIINGSDKTQAELTQEVGFAKSNVLTMFKQGRSPFPIKYVIPLCRATGDDPQKLLTACMTTYMPEVLETITSVNNMAIDETEKYVIKQWRAVRAKFDAAPGQNPQKSKKLRDVMAAVMYG